ncbi:MAG TPA: alpha/beta hydrolase [Bdellovibrionales bacterium]|nr:alpha/beta hydrolase [Bdellovibrionales bacterium]
MKIFCDERPGLTRQDTLFLHGNLASARWWEPTWHEWRKTGPMGLKSMIFTDWRGSGRNPDWQIDKPFTLKELAEDQLEWLRENRREDVALVGHSLGGLIALQMMLLDPRRFSRAVLLDPVGPEGVRFGPEMYDAFRAMAKDPALTRTVIMSTIHQGQDLGDTFRETLASDAFKAVKGIGSSVLEILKTVDLRSPLKQMRVPTLILHGAHDAVIPVGDSEKLAAILPNSKLEILSERGHCWNVEEPAGFVKRLREWL